MDRHKQMEPDVFFNLATPEWQGYPLVGRAHFRSRELVSVNTAHTEDAQQSDAFSLALGQSPMAMMDGRERLYKILSTFGYPCHLEAKDCSIDDMSFNDWTNP